MPRREVAENVGWSIIGGELMLTVLAASTFGWLVLAVAFLFIWVALAFWPARVADRKGHSFLGYFILSLFFFPLALLMAYMTQDRAHPALG
jgi:preprotein translocase subunit SecG